MPFAEVAVNTAMPVRQTFTYRLPDGLAVEVGHAVYVPFGQRTLQGVVLEVTARPGFPEARDIEALIDPQPFLYPYQAALARRLADHYLAPLFDCVALMLPPGFKRKPLTLLRPRVIHADGPDRPLTPRQRQALDYIAANGRVEAEELAGALGLRSVSAIVDALVARQLVERSFELARPKVRPKVVPHLRLLVPADQALAAAAELEARGSAAGRREAAALAALADESPLPLSQVRAAARLTPAQLRDLLDRRLVAVEEMAVLRDPLAGRVYPRRPLPSLTPEQEEAYRQIAAGLEEAAAGARVRPFLLHGVTGSGKTEVYLQALAKAVALGRRAIALVPEISLTPQTVRRFSERFPGQVAVMHSGLSLGEHFDMWHQVRQGRCAVVIGSRSTIFAPQPDLGLVILDEEHEWTYKQQEPSPRYHTRKVAEWLCELAGAVLLLGSATPDVETYHRAHAGFLRLLRLPCRVQPVPGSDGGEPIVVTAPLPEVQVVDLRAELRQGHRSIFSRPLLAALDTAVAAGQQAILFLNRRGTAAFLQCRDCGHVPACSGCAVSLTYHEPAGRLVCHHCHRQRRVPAACPQCGSPRIRTLGIGTERVEEEVRRAFPGLRTLRWDRDVAPPRSGAHERILGRFLAHEADVLIGTQMVAKGLDMPKVGMVGVISADVALHFPDFRSSERTFQLLEQVAGRAGRAAPTGPDGQDRRSSGQAIIQTYSPDHYAIQAAGRHDYEGFYRQETEFRRRLGYPPFGRLARLMLSHPSARYAQEEAFRLARLLKAERDRRGIPNLDVLGPAPAFVPKVRGRYRWQILLRGTDPAELLRQVSFPQGWAVDIDPVSLL